MAYLLSFLISVFIAASALASEVPPIVPNGTTLLQADGTVCAQKKSVERVKATAKHMIISPWRNQYMKTKNMRDFQTANEVSARLEASTIVVIPRIYYRNTSSKTVSFCSARILVNGMPLIMSGNEGRNVFRYIVTDDDTYMIDYDIELVSPWNYPAPLRSERS